jgi:hypothetical protein
MVSEKENLLLEKLGLISAIILFTYSLTSFISLPKAELNLNFLGIAWDFNFELNTYISILVPAFAGAGAYWLVSTHPAHSQDRYPLQHCILPTLTAWVIGLPLTQMSNETNRWIVFLLCGALLILVLTAEYIVVDIKHEQRLLAAGLLKALSLAMFFFIVYVVRMNGLRLYLFLPAVALTAFFILLRVFYLQTGGRWLFNWAVIITAVIVQIALGLHYLPVTPVSYGLIDFAAAYPIKRGRENVWTGVVIMIIFLVLAILL